MAAVTEERPGLLDAFRLRDADGRIDRGLRWGSMLLCVVDIAVYAVCLHLLSGPLDTVTAMAPGWLSAAVGILIPPALGTALCALAWPAFPGERRMMGAACRRMLVLSLWAFAAAQILLWGDGEAQLLILRAFASHVLPAVLMDAGAVLFLYRRWLWEDEDDEDDEEEDGRS